MLNAMSPNRIHDIIDCNLKEAYPILVIFGTDIPDPTGDRTTVQVPTSHLQCVLLHYMEKTKHTK